MKLIQSLTIIVLLLFSHPAMSVVVVLKPELVSSIIGAIVNFSRPTQTPSYVTQGCIAFEINEKTGLYLLPGILAEGDSVSFQFSDGQDLWLPDIILKRLSRLLIQGESFVQDIPDSELSPGALYTSHRPEQLIMAYLGFGVTNTYSDFSISTFILPYATLTDCINNYPVPSGSVVQLSYNPDDDMDITMLLYLGKNFFLIWDKLTGVFYIRTAEQLDNDKYLRKPVEYSILTGWQLSERPVTHSVFIQMAYSLYYAWTAFQSQKHSH